MSTWDLSVFYNDLASWDKDLEKLPLHIEKLAGFQGKLGTFENFKAFHLEDEVTTKLVYRLYGFIHLHSDLNLKDMVYAERNQKIMLYFSKLGQATAYVSPEIIALGEEKVLGFVEQDDALSPYKFPYQKLFAQQKHVLSGDQEKILANFGPTRGIGSQLHQALSIVDAIDEEVTLSNGEKQIVTSSNYRSLLPTLSNPEDRRLVFEAAFKRYKQNKTSYAHAYNLVLQQLAASYPLK